MIIRVHRVLVTCPKIKDEIYVVINERVGSARDVGRSKIYEEGYNF